MTDTVEKKKKPHIKVFQYQPLDVAGYLSIQPLMSKSTQVH